MIPSTPPPHHAPIWAIILSVVLPLVFLGLVISELARRPPVALSKAAIELEARLAAKPPDVVILGNSVAERDIDAEQLLRLMERPELRAQKVWCLGCLPATWYEMLKYRVFENGHRPQLLIVIGYPAVLVDTSYGGRPKFIGDWMVPEEPTIMKKTLGASSSSIPGLSLLRRRGEQIRERQLGAVRDRAVGLAFGLQGDAAEKHASEALNRVFSTEGALRQSTRARVVPVVEETSKPTLLTKNVVPARDSYMSDIIRVSQEAGAKVVVVTAPWSPGAQDHLPSPELVRDLATTITELGAGWVPLHDPGIPGARYSDIGHLNNEGMALFTEMLARELQAIDALGEGPLKPSLIPLSASQVTRSGPVPILALPSPVHIKRAPCLWRIPGPLPFPSDLEIQETGLRIPAPFTLMEDGHPLTWQASGRDLRKECNGGFKSNREGVEFTPSGSKVEAAGERHYEARLREEFPIGSGADAQYWVFPGMTMRLSFAEAWGEARGPFELSAGALVLGGTSAATLSLVSSDGRRQEVDFTGTSRKRATLLGEEPVSSNWTIEISSPADGPYLLVRTLTAGTGHKRSWLIGGSSDEQGVLVVLVGRVPARPLAERSWANPPPELPPVEVIEGEPSRMILGPWASLSALNVNRLALTSSPSPFHLVAKGVSMPTPISCRAWVPGQPGQWCERKDHVQFIPPPGSPPPSDWRIALNEDRKYAASLWLYPGDIVRFTLNRSAYKVGPSELLLRGFSVIGDGTSPITLVVRYNGEERVRFVVPMSELREETLLRLPERLPPDGTKVEIEVSSTPDADWFLISFLSLREGQLFEESPEIRTGSR